MISLSVGCGDYDRTSPLFDGRVTIPGVELRPVLLPPSELFPRAFRDAEFEVAELSASTQLVQIARGAARYVAIPVFLARSFRLDAIYVRSDRGIERPEDLNGRRIGVPEYQMTMAVWIRGILRDHYGVDFGSVTQVTGGVDTPGRKERVPLALPPAVAVEPAPEGRSLGEMLAAGEIDALLSPYPPAIFADASIPLKRLFADAKAEEKRYFGQTRMFPIMHLLGVRRDVVDSRPAVAALIETAFERARSIALETLRRAVQAPATPIMLPWLASSVSEMLDLFGDEPWPYGVEANRSELDALCRYAHEQHLTDRRVTIEEIFPNVV